jgi:hypothetical protein
MNITKANGYTPPIELRRFCQTLLSDEVRGNKDEAERKSGVRKQVFYYHFKLKPEFRQWYSDFCDESLKRSESLATSHLIKQIEAGDIQAIKLYYELIGKISNKVSVNNTNIIKNIVNPLGKLQDEELDGILTGFTRKPIS